MQCKIPSMNNNERNASKNNTESDDQNPSKIRRLSTSS